MRHGKTSTRFHLILKLLFIFSFFVIPLKGLAQYDYEHYVPPFYNGSSHYRDIGWHKAVLSTNSVKDITVHIYKGYNDEIATVTVSNKVPVEFTFTTPSGSTKGTISNYPYNYDFPQNVVGALSLNKVLSQDGLRFYSSDGPFFVNMRHSTQDQGSSLTTKGTYAYGKEFLSGHVYTDKNSATSRRSHFISVMATEDNTKVDFTDIKVSRLTKYNSTYKYLESRTITPSEVITTTLNRGESYIIGVDHDLPGFSYNDRNAMNGTSVVADKPIVMNTGSWTAGPSGQDIGVDQIVPIDQLRDEYIVMKGQGNNTTERPIIVATEDNTPIYVNGSLVHTIPNKGGHYPLNNPYNSEKNAFIKTNGKAVYVYQTLSGSSSSIGPTVGLNFIPPVSTSGIREVTVPFAEKLAERGVTGIITILSQTGAVISYSKNGEEALHPVSDIFYDPVQIAGQPQWQIFKSKVAISGNYRFYSNKAINVAWLVKSGVVGAAGYYSGFTKAISKITPDLDVTVDGDLDLICESYEDDIQVSIKDPLPDFYEWYVDDFTKDPIIENGPLVVKAPNKETSYYVVGSYRDPAMDQLYNGSFTEMTIYSDYSFEGTGNYANLQNPGEYCRVQQSTQADPGFSPSFKDMDNDYMMMAISQNRGDTIFKGTSVDVVKGFNYIVKVHGRKVTGNSYTKDQYLKVLVNGDTIVKNFKLDDPTKWQSVSALWKPKGAKNAIVKLLNNNASGDYAAFALDSITFVQSVQDTAVFVAKVVPNYSYDNNGKTFHFCKGEQNSLDVSNGDTSWYTYAWFKKNDSDGYDALVNGDDFAGVDTHELIFKNPSQSQEGEYRCVIGFKEEYQDCGTSSEEVHADLNVFVDEAATVDIQPNNSGVCEGSSKELQAVVTGANEAVKWYIKKSTDADYPTDPVATGLNFTLETTYAAGVYNVKCVAVNGCGSLEDIATVEVLKAPDLTSLDVNPNLCVGQNIILTANATGGGTLLYSWKEGSDALAETGNTLTIPASLDKKASVFSVGVTSVYNIGGIDISCTAPNRESKDNLDILPGVNITKPLVDATLCEETANHIFKVETEEDESYYNFTWTLDGTDAGTGTQKVISPVTTGDAGNYKVVISNRCETKESSANLIVTEKMVVNDITANLDGPFCSTTNVTVTLDVDGGVSSYRLKTPDGLTNDIVLVGNTYTFEVNNATKGDYEFIVVPLCVGEPFKKTLHFDMIPDFGVLSVNDITTCLGENVAFVADVSPLSELTYEWKDKDDHAVGGNSQTLNINNVTDANLGSYTCKVTDQCGRSKTVTANLNVEKVTTSTTPSTITLCEGDDLQIKIEYLGAPSFQWFYKGDLQTDTDDTFDVANVTTANAGVYVCKVTLACGNVVEVKRTLVVNEHFTVDGTDSPAAANFDICEGEKKELTINISGPYTSLQWFDDAGTHIAAFDGMTSVILPALPYRAAVYNYKARVTGNCEIIEKDYVLQVHEKPILSTADNTLSKCSGPVTLTVTEGGEHDDVTWWKGGVKIDDGNGNPNDYVMAAASSPADDGIYLAKLSSDYCGDLEVSIDLDVRNGIVVDTKSPANTTVCENTPVSLSVTTSGDAVQYKWYKSTDPGTELSDQPTLDLGNVSLAQEGTYKLELSNDMGCDNQTLSFDLVVNKNPTVTNPDDKVICETQASVDFTVVGDAEGTVQYQWYKNDVIIVGATAATYTENIPVNGSSYYCEVTGSVGGCVLAKSEKATLTIIEEVSVTDPHDQNIADGANAIFSVVASGEPDYSYQWQENSGSGWGDISNGGKYSGAKTETLVITKADKASFDGNQYRCLVSSSGAICSSNATSGAADLTINEVIKIAAHPSKETACEGNSINLTVEAYYDALTYTWQFDDGLGYKNAVGQHGMTAGLAGKVSTLTIPNVNTGMNTWKFKCLVSDGSSTDEWSNETTINVLEDIVVTTTDGNFNPCLNDLFTLSVSTSAGDDIKYKWYKVGAESTVLSTSSTYNFGNITLAKEGTYKCDIYNDLHCSDVTRTFTVDVKEPATVTDPADVTMCITDANPMFTVTGGGDDITYQWYRNGTLIGGATTASYTETAPSNGQTFYCQVSNSCETVNSKSATLTVIENVDVTDPADLTIADGANAEFSVMASGEPNYSYQWQENSGSGWGDITNGGKYAGATSEKLVITNAKKAAFNGNQYRCIVETSGTVCIPSVTSGAATLSINDVIKIVADAHDAEVCFNDNAILTVEGTNDALTFTWEYDKGSGWNPAHGAESMTAAKAGKVSTLTIPCNDLDINNWKFRCLVSDGLSTDDYSNEVKVRVLQDITASAVDATPSVCENELVSLEVNATGDDILYKWYKDSAPGTILSTNSSYTINNVALTDEGAYTCEVYNLKSCSDQTVNFALDVKEFVSVSNPADKTMCETAADPVFTVVASGDPAYTYQWYDKDGIIAGATADSYTATSPENGQSYYCEVSNSCNTVSSAAADLTVVENLEVTNPANVTIADGGDAEFIVTATGEPSYTYQWEVLNGASWDALVNGGVYAGVKTNKLELTAVDRATYDGKQYRCVVNTDGGVCVPSVNSAAATLTINAVDKIVNQPKADDVCIGATAEITIKGTPAATNFAWEYKDGSGIWKDVATNTDMSVSQTGQVSKLEVDNATLAMNTWQFKCTVGAAAGTPEPSQAVSIRVLKEITVSTVDETFEPCLNEVFSLSVNATDGDDIKYKWYEKTTPGVTLSETKDYNFGNIELADEGIYVCEIYNDEHCSDKLVEFTVDVKEPATVTDPSDLTMCVTDGNPTFTVTGGGDNITYQWYKNGVAIASTNSNTYTETTPANGQTFYCEVSNTCETVKSKSALLTVVENVDVTDPVDLTIADGANAEFSVVASGEPNYSYQWQENSGSGWGDISNGGKYAGATSEKLVITNALKAAFNGNQYRCIVETDGTVCIPDATSEAATLSINDVVKIVADAHDAEVCFNDNAVLTVEGTNDALTFTWEYDKGSGWNPAHGAESMIAAKAGKVSTLTIPCDDLDINNWKFRCLVSDALSTDVYTSEVKVRVLEDITASAVDAAPSICENLPVTFEVNASGDDILYKWIKNSDPGTTLSTNSTYTINNVTLADEGGYSCRVYNLKLCSDITLNFTLDVKELVAVTNPADMIICETDADPVFTVVASGDAAYNYQWYDKDGLITGATADSYTATSPENGQSYYCKVSNVCNTVNSTAASLTVVENLEVTDPVDVTIADGDNTEFSVTATGEPNYSYQWQVLNGAIWDDLTNVGIYSGVNTDKLILTGADRATYNGKKYRCVVNTDGGVCIASVTSGEATLSLKSVLKIFEHPQAIEICEGSPGEFVIKGTTDGLTYNWEYKIGAGAYATVGGVAGLSTEAITNGSKLKINASTTAMNNWTFRCIVKDGSSADETSNEVKVEVIEPVGFDPIADQELCFEESKQMELTGVSGTGDITYSWTKGATVLSTTKIMNIGGSDNGAYTVTVSNGVCPDVNQNFNVSHSTELGIDPWANASELCIGDTETLTANVTVDPGLTANFEWFKDDATLSVFTKDLNLVVADKTVAGQYKLVVNDGCSTKSISGYINVFEPITRVGTDWADETICLGSELKLETNISGDILAYTWKKDGTPLTADASYIVASVAMADAGTYTCDVTDKCGTTISYSITVDIIDAPSITTGIDGLAAVCAGDALKIGPIITDGIINDITWELPTGVTGTLEDSDKSYNLGVAETSEEGSYKVTVKNKCGEDVSVGTQIVNPVPTLADIDPQIVCEFEDVIFTANATGRNLSYKWYINGIEQTSATTSELLIAGADVRAEDANTPKDYTVKCIVNGDCSPGMEKVTTLTVNPNTILHETLPNKVVYVGSDYTLNLNISGLNLAYKWTHEKTDGTKVVLTGETGPSLTLSDIEFDDAGYYNCLITGECGQRLASGKVTVKEPVKIVDGLTDMLTKCLGEPLNLEITTSGMVDKIAWFKVSGGVETKLPSTTNSFIIPELKLSDAGIYKCVVEGEGISQLIETIDVRVYPLTTLNAPLESLTRCEGEELNWSVDVSGATDLTYDWEFKGASISDKKMYHVDALALNQEGEYEVTVKGLCGEVTTSANLEIIQLPAFVDASISKEVCENTPSVEFTVEYTGENLRYQWRKNGVAITGETTPVLGLTNIQLDDAANYNCRVYSTCGEEFSPEVELKVIPQLVIVNQPVDAELCSGEDVIFSTNVNGNELTYQWQKDGVDIAGETTNTITIAGAKVSDSGYYTCILTDKCTGKRTTKPAELKANPLPNSEILGRMILCAKEDRVTYTTIDQPDIIYDWGVAGGIFAGPDDGLKTRITWEEVANGMLSIQITDMETGCKSKVDSIVTLNALPEVNLTAMDSKGVCEEAFELSGGFPAGGIYWVNGISEEEFDPSEQGPGEYEVKYSYTDDKGCSNVSTIKTLTVEKLPTVDITDDTTIGSCKPFQLNATTKETNIKWSPAADLSDANSMTPMYTPSETGVVTFNAQVVDKHGCVGVDLVNLTVAPLPIVTTINDTTVGQCNQLVLKTDIVGDKEEVIWTNADHMDDAGATSPKLVSAPAGVHTYKISVTDKYGCDANNQVTVTMVEDPKLEEDKFGCEGDKFEVNIAGMESPVWDDGYNDNLRTIEKPGEYVLNVSNKFGCGDEQLFKINPTPKLGLKDTLIYEGQEVVLRTNLPMEYGPYTYEWQDGSIMPQFKVTETGKYILNVEDNIGCTAKDSSMVTVKPIGIESPNAFTPNSNNDNDRFYLKDINYDIQKFELYVYDRWGELLFKSNQTGYNGGWDGKYKGKLCPTGAYVWVAFINGKLTNKGTFMLVR